MTDKVDLGKEVVAWASGRKDIEALIQIGSRVQPEGHPDHWSDWDFHVICKSIQPYLNYDWSSIFGRPCWSTYVRKTSRNAFKVSLIFEDGYEVDLILLASWQIKMVYFLMKYPSLHPKLPGSVKVGIYDLRHIVRPGYKIHKGGTAWERRLSALKTPFSPLIPDAAKFEKCVSEFWQQALWIYKQIDRGGFITAQRAFHVGMRESMIALLRMEAEKRNMKTRDEARRAEYWISPGYLEQIKSGTAREKKILLNALVAEMTCFNEASDEVARLYNLPKPTYAPLSAWLLKQCEAALKSVS